MFLSPPLPSSRVKALDCTLRTRGRFPVGSVGCVGLCVFPPGAASRSRREPPMGPAVDLVLAFPEPPASRAQRPSPLRAVPGRSCPAAGDSSAAGARPEAAREPAHGHAVRPLGRVPGGALRRRDGGANQRLPFEIGRRARERRARRWSLPTPVSRDPSIYRRCLPPSCGRPTTATSPVSSADARASWNKTIDITGTGHQRRAPRLSWRGASCASRRARLPRGPCAPRSSTTTTADARIPVRGQTVALRCRGAGMLIGSPVLEACVGRSSSGP